MTVRRFVPRARSAAISCSGMPQSPKPPTISVAPSWMSAIASAAFATTLLRAKGGSPRACAERDAAIVAARRSARGRQRGELGAPRPRQVRAAVRLRGRERARQHGAPQLAVGQAARLRDGPLAEGERPARLLEQLVAARERLERGDRRDGPVGAARRVALELLERARQLADRGARVVPRDQLEAALAARGRRLVVEAGALEEGRRDRERAEPVGRAAGRDADAAELAVDRAARGGVAVELELLQRAREV